VQLLGIFLEARFTLSLIAILLFNTTVIFGFLFFWIFKKVEELKIQKFRLIFSEKQ